MPGSKKARISRAIARLTPKQQRALEVLLVGGTDQQAASAAGVARTTVTEWRNNLAGFADALTSARGDLLKRTAARLHAATTLAVRALEAVANDARSPAARVAAARAILEFSQRSIELQEIEERLEELEVWFEENKGKFS